MVFACQTDSYQKQGSSTVVSCVAASMKCPAQGKNVNIDGYEVILDDTILFPEGGGQPDDRGRIGSANVLRVTRRLDKAVHFTTEPLEVGLKVDVVVDWQRRFDHMQQHSGQHLITAIADNLYGFKTTSWNLGEKLSFIELDAPDVSREQVAQIETVVNEKIRDCVAVNVIVYDDGAEELKQFRTRGLPDDHRGAVRVVRIEGVDGNMCCGTHVSNLGHLQIIKLLHVEEGKKGKSNLYFAVGGRVLTYLSECLHREKKISDILNNGPDQHVALVDKMQKSLRLSLKNETALLREMAVVEAQRLKALQPRPSYFSSHRREGNVEYMTIFANEVADENTVLFLTVGDERGAGQMLLSGRSDFVAAVGPRVITVLNGKGAAKGTKFQGKVQDLGKRGAAEDTIKSALDLSD